MAKLSEGTGTVVLEGIDTPVVDTDAANKAYVDANAGDTITVSGGLERVGDDISIEDLGVTNAKLANGAVANDKIAANAVTESKMNASNVPTSGQVLSSTSGTEGFTWVDQTGGDLPNYNDAPFGSIDDGSILWTYTTADNPATEGQIAIDDQGDQGYTLQFRTQDIDTVNSVSVRYIQVGFGSPITFATYVVADLSITDTLVDVNVMDIPIDGDDILASLPANGTALSISVSVNQFRLDLSDINDVSATAATDNQVLTWDNTNFEWAPADTLDNITASEGLTRVGDDIQIADDGVTTDKIDDLAITAAKIADGVIDHQKLDSTNTPLVGQVLSASSTPPGFTWVNNASSGSEIVTPEQIRASGNYSDVSTWTNNNAVGNGQYRPLLPNTGFDFRLDINKNDSEGDVVLDDASVAVIVGSPVRITSGSNVGYYYFFENSDDTNSYIFDINFLTGINVIADDLISSITIASSDQVLLANATEPGFAPILTENSAEYLNGEGAYAQPTLDALGDVGNTAPSANQVLTYDGNVWNAADAQGGDNPNYNNSALGSFDTDGTILWTFSSTSNPADEGEVYIVANSSPDTGYQLQFRQADVDTANSVSVRLFQIGYGSPITFATYAVADLAIDSGFVTVDLVGGPLDGDDILATLPADNTALSLAVSVNQYILPELGDLPDVSATAATDNQVLTWNDTNSEWEPQASQSGGATTLGGLNDVNADNVADGFVLRYDGDNSNYRVHSIGDTNRLYGGLDVDMPSDFVVPDGSGTSAVAIGDNAIADDNSSIAIGNTSNSSGMFSVAIGRLSVADISQATAVGNAASAGGSASVALGTISDSSGTFGVAVGNSSRATNVGSVGIGASSEASAFGSTAIGLDATASHLDSTAVGTDSETSQDNEIRLGVEDSHVTIEPNAAGTEGSDNQLASVRYVKDRISDASRIVNENINGIQTIVRMAQPTPWGDYRIDPYQSDDTTFQIAMSVIEFDASEPTYIFYPPMLQNIVNNMNGGGLTTGTIPDFFEEITDVQTPNNVGGIDGNDENALGWKYTGYQNATIWMATPVQILSQWRWVNHDASNESIFPPNVTVKFQLVHVKPDGGVYNIDDDSAVVIAETSNFTFYNPTRVAAGATSAHDVNLTFPTQTQSQGIVNVATDDMIALRYRISFKGNGFEWDNDTNTGLSLDAYIQNTSEFTPLFGIEHVTIGDSLVVESATGDLVYTDQVSSNTLLVVDNNSGDPIIPAATLGLIAGDNITITGKTIASTSEALPDTIVVNGTEAANAGTDAIAIGSGAGAGNNAIAIGPDSSTGVNNNSIAIGHEAIISTDSASAIVLGRSATADGESTFAMGNAASASADNALAFGAGASASATETVVIGHDASATFPDSVAIGANASVPHTNSVALGHDAVANAANQVVLGGAAVTNYRLGATTYTPSNDADIASKGYVDGAYTGSNGVDITSQTASIDFRVETNNPLEISGTGDDAGLSLNIDEDGPLQKTTNGLDVILEAQGGLAIGSLTSGIEVLLPTDSGLQKTATGLSLNAGIDELTDVVLQTGDDAPTDGQVLTFDGTNWQNEDAASGSSTLATLTDVTLGTLTDGQVLEYDADTSMWVNTTLSGGGTFTAGTGLSFNADSTVLNTDGNMIEYSAVGLGVTPVLPALGDSIGGEVVIGSNTSADGGGPVAVGFDSSAMSNGSIAIGLSSSAVGSSTIALGDEASASTLRAIAIGHDATSSGQSGVVIGDDASSSGGYSVAIGDRASGGSSDQAIVIGERATASDVTGISIGYSINPVSTLDPGPTISASNAIAIGQAVSASGVSSLVIGDQASTTGSRSVALGFRARSTSSLAVSIGSDSTTGGNTLGIAIGERATVGGSRGIAIGSSSDPNDVFNADLVTAGGDNSIAIGRIASSAGDESIAIGDGASSASTDSAAFGRGATAGGSDALALGAVSSASATRSIAVGHLASATGISAVSMGESALGSGLNATALGNDTDATSTSSTAVGDSAQATGIGSVSMGSSSNASGDRSIVLGSSASSSGENSISIGRSAGSAGASSVAIGDDPSTGTSVLGIAIGERATVGNTRGIAIGTSTDSSDLNATRCTASGISSIAVGRGARATGQTSLAIGDSAFASNVDCIAIGEGATSSFANSFAIGNQATTTVGNSTVLGSGSSHRVFAGTREITPLDYSVSAIAFNTNTEYFVNGYNPSSTINETLKYTQVGSLVAGTLKFNLSATTSTTFAPGDRWLMVSTSQNVIDCFGYDPGTQRIPVGIFSVEDGSAARGVFGDWFVHSNTSATSVTLGFRVRTTWGATIPGCNEDIIANFSLSKI